MREMKRGMIIEYLMCRADLNFEVDFGVNGAIGTIVTKWDLIEATKFCNLLHFTKRQFYKRSIQTITESKDNIKALYKITDSLIGKGVFKGGGFRGLTEIFRFFFEK